MPLIILKHLLYLYSLNNQKLIDGEVQDVLNEHEICLFHPDTDILLIFTNDYRLLIDKKLNEYIISSLSIERKIVQKHILFKIYCQIICTYGLIKMH